MSLTATRPPPPDLGALAALDRACAQILDARSVRAVFQPVVTLATGEVVGLEALMRGPAGTELESPRELIAAARRLKRIGELDWIARAAAFRAFEAADLPPSMSLFVNIEPESLAQPCPADLREAVARAESLLRVIVEVNDRALRADPGGLLRAVDRARASGWGIALDDVGASRTTLSALPLVSADVIKLDLRLLRRAEAAESSAITMAVLRIAEEQSVSIVVEGLESEDDVAWAMAIGARYGQGYHLGGPTDEIADLPVPRDVVRLRPLAEAGPAAPMASPFAAVADLGAVTMTHQRLDEIAVSAFTGLIRPGTAPVLLAGRGTSLLHDPEVLRAYPPLPSRPLLTVLFATLHQGLTIPGVQRVLVGHHDPVGRETFLVILSELEALAVVARRSVARPGLVEVVLTQDRTRVRAMARALIARVPTEDLDGSETEAPAPAPPGAA